MLKILTTALSILFFTSAVGGEEQKFVDPIKSTYVVFMNPSMGTAVSISPKYLVTNAHIFHGESKIGDSVRLMDSDSITKSANIVFLGKEGENDFAILEMNSVMENFFTVDCNPTILLGEDLAYVGHPTGHFFSYRRGTYSSEYDYIGEPISIDHPDYFSFDGIVRPGNSGGPLFSLTSGKMVGLVTILLPDIEMGVAYKTAPICEKMKDLEK